MYALSAILALAASVSAYTVTQPNPSQGWTNVGAQPLAWTRVDTDPRNFTVILTNQDRSLLPMDQVLVAEQDGVNQQSVDCNPPSGGWPLGSHFRVNLVKSTVDTSTIYAQSSEFDIKAPNATSSTASSLTLTRPTTPVAPPPVATSSSSTTTPTGGNTSTPNPNGSSAIKGSIGLMAVLGAVTLFVV